MDIFTMIWPPVIHRIVLKPLCNTRLLMWQGNIVSVMINVNIYNEKA